MTVFLTIKAVNEDIKSERKFADNHVQSILRLIDGWANFSFPSSENSWLLVINWYVWFAWRVAE